MSSGKSGTSITKQNLGPGINLTNWICLVVMCLVALLKVSSKLIRNHTTIKVQSLQSDDYFVTGAMVRTNTDTFGCVWLNPQILDCRN